jgi:hypothetical protein
MELRHLAHVDDGLWDQFGPGAVGIGWDLGLFGLSLHLSTGGAGMAPEESAAWMASEEGKQFVTASGQAWWAAAIAAGEDEAKATAASERCIAAYTGATPEEPAGAP